MILDIINIFNNFFVQNVLSLVMNIAQHIPLNAIVPQEIAGFLKACIVTFIPYEAIFRCITLQIPFLITNAAWKLLLRIKSFVPTMGH